MAKLECAGVVFRYLAAICVCFVLTSCASPTKRAEAYVAQDEWMKAVLEYRKIYGQHPTDIDYKSRLKQTELKAADYYYQQGSRLVEQGDWDGAIEQFQQGLLATQDHAKLQQAMADVLARKRATQLYQDGINLRAAGKLADAKREFENALDVYPWYSAASAALAAIKTEEEGKLSEGLALSSNAPVTLNFRQTDLKQAFEFLAKSFGINVMFDESIKSVPVTLFGKDVTFDQGLNLLLATTKMFYKRIGPSTILVAPDTKDKRGQYEDHLVRTYQLNIVRAKEMADILKGLVSIKKLTINETLNTIVVRDTEDVIKLVERIIDSNDRKPAEIILDVEVLEINRNKSEKLGLDLGTYSLTAAVPSTTVIPVLGSIRNVIETSTLLTIPSATLRFFKQDVDAQVLANPKIRVTSGKSAKIHVGDRVPLRASSIVDATGQSRTTFDYKDIGIQLSVEPIVNLDNSASVKLGLEVSSLGENLGTTTEPAYRIGTRHAETVMLLRDGETAILGGLIRDEDRNTHVKVPGLGDIPALGKVFTSYDLSNGRTDVLLTITPRVVRGWDIPPRRLQEYYSGTETLYSDKPIFAALETTAASATSGESPTSPTDANAANAKTLRDSSDSEGNKAEPEAKTNAPMLGFGSQVYELSVGQDADVTVVGSGLAARSSVNAEILYNSLLINYQSATKIDAAVNEFNATADNSRGVLTMSFDLQSGEDVKDETVLAHVKVTGAKSGVSYLVFRTPSIKNSNGEAVSAQVHASRVVVK